MHEAAAYFPGTSRRTDAERIWNSEPPGGGASQLCPQLGTSPSSVSRGLSGVRNSVSEMQLQGPAQDAERKRQKRAHACDAPEIRAGPSSTPRGLLPAAGLDRSLEAMLARGTQGNLHSSRTRAEHCRAEPFPGCQEAHGSGGSASLRPPTCRPWAPQG